MRSKLFTSVASPCFCCFLALLSRGICLVLAPGFAGLLELIAGCNTLRSDCQTAELDVTQRPPRLEYTDGKLICTKLIKYSISGRHILYSLRSHPPDVNYSDFSKIRDHSFSS
eukprot:g12590.t1